MPGGLYKRFDRAHPFLPLATLLILVLPLDVAEMIRKTLNLVHAGVWDLALREFGEPGVMTPPVVRVHGLGDLRPSSHAGLQLP